MDNLNSYQNNFGPNSSSSTNFYTQKNFHPRQEASLSPNHDDYNANSIPQENSYNNNNEEMEAVTINQSFKRKNKTLNMIKNSLVHKIKNNVLLKEINHAFNEIERFTLEGDLASAKMMENELYKLHNEVIKNNLYPVTKYGNSTFYESGFNTNFNRSMNKKSFNKNITISKTKIIQGNENYNAIDEENYSGEESNIQNNKNNINDNRNNLNNDNNINNSGNENNLNEEEENQINNENYNNNQNNYNMNGENNNLDVNNQNNKNIMNNSGQGENENFQNQNNPEEAQENNNQINNNIYNMQSNEQIQYKDINENIEENNIPQNQLTRNKQIAGRYQNNNKDNINYDDNYEDLENQYEYEGGMYYDNDEFKEVYEEDENEDDPNRKKRIKKSRISKIIEQSKTYVNGDSNYPYKNQDYPNNIQPKKDLQDRNNNIDQANPRLNLGNQYIDKNIPNPNESSKSQTFNPSQNSYPEIPPNSQPPYPNPYPNTLYQNPSQNAYPEYPQNNEENIPQNQNPKNYPKNQDTPNNLQYLNYPLNNKGYPLNPDMNRLKKGKKPRPKSVKNLKANPNNYPYKYNIYDSEYPQRPIINFGKPLALINAQFRRKPQPRNKSPANILFGQGGKANCFACDVECSISRSGNSPNNYNPYYASFKKPRYDVTYYDGAKYGYYQYSSKIVPENN